MKPWRLEAANILGHLESLISVSLGILAIASTFSLDASVLLRRVEENRPLLFCCSPLPPADGLKDHVNRWEDMELPTEHAPLEIEAGESMGHDKEDTGCVSFHAVHSRKLT